MATFGELLKVSFKSEDTEEWLDVHFTRPIGLVFALLWNRLGIHPNVITIVSFGLGAGAGWMFHFTDLRHNLYGVSLLMLANFCDSTDGQMARLTGKKTLLGRVLDGFSGDVWFFCIYVGIVVRLWSQHIPGTTIEWGIWGFMLAAVAGFLSHAPQSSLADYYRQIHLYFLLGREGSELDSSAQQRQILKSLPRRKWFERLYRINYASYCSGQEKRTPQFQAFFSKVREKWPNVVDMPQELRQDFRQGSLPLMKYTNMLTFNVRAITIYVTCLLDCPWVYLLVEVIILNIMYAYMHRSHERLCLALRNKYLTA